MLSLGMAVMFGALLFLGWEIYQQAPTIPETVQTASGETLYTGDDIVTG